MKVLLRIGVAGIGHVGKMHLLNLKKFKEIKIVGVADKSKKNLKLAERLGVKSVYTDYVELFEKEEIDAAIIALPNFLKTDSVTIASENGIDVMIEKPLARSLKEASSIDSTLQKNGTRLMVSTNFRYHPHVKKLKLSLDSGSIGKVIIATLEYIMNGPWSHPLYPTPTPDWWFNKDLVGGGALLDMGYHLLDLFTWMFGECGIEAVDLGFHYNLDQEDSASLIVRSKTGTRGVINCGWFSNIIFPKVDLRVIMHGTNGYLNTDELKPNSIYLNGAIEGSLNFFRRITGRPLKLLSYTYYYSSYAEVLSEFLSCIKSGSDFPVDLRQQLWVMEAIEKSYGIFKIRHNNGGEKIVDNK